MGLDWKTSFINALSSVELDYYFVEIADYQLLRIKKYPIAFNLLEPETAEMSKVLDIQKAQELIGIQVINCWKDVWLNHNSQVISRLRSIAGGNEKVAARKCKVHQITKIQAESFLELHHLHGSATAKFCIGLEYNDALIAVATFNWRYMHAKRQGYKSAELIRFCNRSGITVVGGLSKMLKFFIARHQPDDVMTYADKDWSTGEGYLKLGFKEYTESLPLTFWVDNKGRRFTVNRLPVENSRNLPLEDYYKVFNTGNRKFIFQINDA